MIRRVLIAMILPLWAYTSSAQEILIRFGDTSKAHGIFNPYMYFRLVPIADLFGGQQTSGGFNLLAIDVVEELDTDEPNFALVVNQTKFGSNFLLNLPKMGEVKANYEFDFAGSNTTIRLRKMYFEYKGFTIGQTWNVITDLDAYPGVFDWDGPPSTFGVRSPQLTYAHQWKDKHELAVSLEHPVEDARIGNPQPDTVFSGTYARLPVFGMHYRFDWRNGHVFVGMLARELRYLLLQEFVNTYGLGGSISGKFKFFDDNLKLTYQVAGGAGITHYYWMFGGFLLEALPVSPTKVNPLLSCGGYFGIDWNWPGKKWASNATIGSLQLFTPKSPGWSNTIAEAYYVSGNVSYSPFKWLTFGMEVLYGRTVAIRKLSGDALRLEWLFQLQF